MSPPYFVLNYWAEVVCVAGQIRSIEHPVLALDCSPGRYPAPRSLDHLSQYLKWSTTITSPAFDFIDANLPRPFIALHFRHAFASAGCGFSVGQCHDFGESLEDNRVCTPSVEEMRNHLTQIMSVFESRGRPVQSLFVASDRCVSSFMLCCGASVSCHLRQ